MLQNLRLLSKEEKVKVTPQLVSTDHVATSSQLVSVDHVAISSRKGRQRHCKPQHPQWEQGQRTDCARLSPEPVTQS